MPTIGITWRSKHDARTCLICAKIDGYTWFFEDKVLDNLVHPEYGEVWNIVLGSLAHEHQIHKGSKYGLISDCRCHIESNFDLKDVAVVVHQVLEVVKSEYGPEIEKEVDDIKSGSSRRTTFEDIGVDPSKYGLE